MLCRRSLMSWATARWASTTARDQLYLSLSADDVNMVRMGMTGADRDAETVPSDNYSITLSRVPTCTGADIKVS